MNSVTIRPGTLEDAEQVERLRVAAWQAAYRGLIPDAYLDRIPVDGARRRNLMAQRAGRVAENVAVSGQEIVGWLIAGPCRDDDRQQARHGEIYACYVLPGWWGRGVGGRLLAHAVTTLQASGRTDVSLWVLEGNNRARRVYEAHGFRPDGNRKLIDLDGPVAEVRYQRLLEPSG